MRLIILMLSMGSVVAYGHALAGWGAKFFGAEMNYPYVIGGLSGGTLSAALAIWLWKRWLRREIMIMEQRQKEKSEKSKENQQ